MNNELVNLMRNSSQVIQKMAIELDRHLTEKGCYSYVKTIYVGYEIGGNMVAALYPHANHIEVALALPENADHVLLSDAGHLTWRTMPVLATITSSTQFSEILSLVDFSITRVVDGSHVVLRDNDFFIKHKIERRANRSAVPRRSKS